MDISLCNVGYHIVIHWLAKLHILFRQKNKEFWFNLFCYYHILFTCEFTEASINGRQNNREENVLEHYIFQFRVFNYYYYWNTPAKENTRPVLTLILRRSRMGTVWFYTSTSNKRAARPKLYTKSLTRDLKLMYRRFTLVRISINL